MSNWDKQIEAYIEDIESAENTIKNEKAKKAKADGIIKKETDVISAARSELHDMMLESGVTMEDHPRAKLVVKKSPVRIVKTDDFDIEKLPIDYREIVHKPDMDQIKAAMKRGETVPGFAYEQKPDILQVTIKPKIRKTRGKKS